VRLRYIRSVMTQTIEERLGVGMDAIHEFCKKRGIIELGLFGSVVRDDFGPDSDIDVMVRFDPELRPLGYGYVHVKLELETFLGRNVDMIEFGPIRNPYLRRSIERDLQMIYAAW
jgi:predicted nucleotidyltransferase